MKIGDEVYVHGYVDEIRKGTYVDIVIIRNKGGYFGTDKSEVIVAVQTEPQYDFGEYADRLWKIAYERGKREALEQTEPQTDCSWK